MRRKIYRSRAGKLQGGDDELAVEIPLLINLRSTGGPAKSVAVTMRTPGDDIELALGFLYSEGIIKQRGEVAGAKLGGEGQSTVTVTLAAGVHVDWRRLERHSYTTSSCGVCGKTSLEQVHNAVPFPESFKSWQVPAKSITELPDKLRAAQTTFNRTGGLHGVGLFNLAGELLHHAEDVGRHNAMDKVVGWALQRDLLHLDEHIVVLSGRASFELIQKAAMAGIAFVVAVGAPSSLAVELAEEQGITLCGFVRGGGFNYYVGGRLSS